MHSEATTLDGGFAEPVFDAQATFRAIMDAMARPARAVPLIARATPPAPLAPLSGALALTLIDSDAPVWLDGSLDAEPLRHWLAFHTSASFAAAPGHAAFALVSKPSSMPPLDRFAQGIQEYPDRSATLILQIEALEGGPPLTFRGPGIKGTASIAPRGLPADFAMQWRENTHRFPRGVDLILIAGNEIACLPRSARLVEAGE